MEKNVFDKFMNFKINKLSNTIENIYQFNVNIKIISL